MKILVLEKNFQIFENYLSRHIRDRLTAAGLQAELVHVTTAEAALKSLVTDAKIRIALLDFDLGKKGFSATLPEGKLVIRNGADLIPIVVAVRKRDNLPAIQLVGMASHPFGVNAMGKAGVAAEEKHLAPRTVALLAEFLV